MIADWRGEHLLKITKPVHPNSKDPEQLVSPRRKKIKKATPKPGPKCAHPDCSKLTSAKGKSGVCREHSHSAYCKCGHCDNWRKS